MKYTLVGSRWSEEKVPNIFANKKRFSGHILGSILDFCDFLEASLRWSEVCINFSPDGVLGLDAEEETGSKILDVVHAIVVRLRQVLF